MKQFLCLLLFLSSTSAIADGFPPLDGRVSNCENRWFLKSTDDPLIHLLGFAYLDPTAGFTFEHNGEVKINESGDIVRLPSEFRDKARLIIRFDSDFKVACLSNEIVTKLKLPLIPDWLHFYKDEREPGPHNVTWASQYNHIGASQKALEFLKEAEKQNYKSSKYYFELGFALNALGKFQDAVQQLQVAVKEYPNHTEIIAELAYAHFGLRDLERAVEFYKLALKADKKKTSQRRWEFAQNISVAYSMLDDKKNSDAWKDKADNWKPKP